jgi:hypothetical protein
MNPPSTLPSFFPPSDLAGLEAQRAREVPLYTPNRNWTPGTRVTLNIPFRTKTAVLARGVAKHLGARFDPAKKEWYHPSPSAECMEELHRYRLVDNSYTTAVPPTGTGRFTTNPTGFSLAFSNGWILSVRLPRSCRGSTSEHMDCAIWTGTAWQKFSSTGCDTKSVSPEEFVSISQYVSIQPPTPHSAPPYSPVPATV